MNVTATPQGETGEVMSRTIGFIGLGMMGGAMASHVAAAEFTVVGTDPVPAMRERLEKLGGARRDDPRGSRCRG